MSLRSWRHHPLTRGLASVLVLLVFGMALESAHPGGDDPDCSPAIVLHDHSAHRIASQPSQSTPVEHCFICHALQLLHAARAMRAARLAPPRELAYISSLEQIAVLRGHAATATSRGPPAVRL
jgi:hypothetical protein